MAPNRNKHSIVPDVKQPAREACLAIAKRADVLVYNIRLVDGAVGGLFTVIGRADMASDPQCRQEASFPSERR